MPISNVADNVAVHYFVTSGSKYISFVAPEIYSGLYSIFNHCRFRDFLGYLSNG